MRNTQELCEQSLGPAGCTPALLASLKNDSALAIAPWAAKVSAAHGLAYDHQGEIRGLPESCFSLLSLP